MKITTEDIQVGFHARQILKGISIESKDKELVGICLLYTSDAADD